MARLVSQFGEYAVREHAGKSGRSVFRFRVFRETATGVNGGKQHRYQLAKFRTVEAALKAAAHYHANGERIAGLWVKQNAKAALANHESGKP